MPSCEEVTIATVLDLSALTVSSQCQYSTLHRLIYHKLISQKVKGVYIHLALNRRSGTETVIAGGGNHSNSEPVERFMKVDKTVPIFDTL